MRFFSAKSRPLKDAARAALLILIITPVANSASSPLADFPPGKAGQEIRFGYELLANTPDYLGPRGKIRHLTKSRVACRNCHLDVGMRPFGNSWLDSHALYPQYRAREGQVQTLEMRVNACLTHNLASKPLPLEGREMHAILMYLKWLGRGRPILEKDEDRRLVKLEFLSRPANPAAGRAVFERHCVACHGNSGQGKVREDANAYISPPLWGKESYMIGSSMSRLSILARFIKGNMPYGTTPDAPALTDDEAWDVAAFINSKEHPHWSGKPPFPVLAEKPFDYPMGPFADSFPDSQHFLGPFKPIVDYWSAKKGPEEEASNMGI